MRAARPADQKAARPTVSGTPPPRERRSAKQTIRCGCVHDPTDIHKDARVRRQDETSTDALNLPVDLHIGHSDVHQLATMLKAPPLTNKLTRIAPNQYFQEVNMGRHVTRPIVPFTVP